MFHRTQNKIIIIMSLIALLMMAGLHFLKKSDQEKIALLLSNQRNEKEMLLEKIIELKSSSVENFAYDYTYWDEMVDFVNSGDQVWAKENIEVSMPTFGVGIAWVYRTDLSVLYSKNRIGADPMDQLPLSRDIIEKIVSKGSFCHFFILADPGLIEIFGASIHPTFDEERKTPPQGYFFVGCLWSETYLEEMSELSGTEISLVPPEEEQSDSNTEDLKNFTVTNTKALYGWDGTRLVDARAKSVSLIAETLNEQSNVQYRISTAYSILILVFLSFILFLLINRPLNALSRSLADGNPDLLKGLTSQKNEFGNLAVMISEFYNQKNQLVNDITERKRAEEALRESEERFRSIYENMTIGMYRTTSDGQIVMCNPALIQMLGYASFEELAQRNLEKEGYEPKYDRKAFRERIEGDGQVHGLESAWMKKDGSFIYVSESARVIRDEAGKVLYYEGTVEDITERKKVKDQLLIKDFAVESSVSAIALTDIQGKVIYVNNAYVKMWGYNSANEVLGKHIYEFAESKEIVDDAILALQSGKGFVSEETARKNDGTIFDIQISANIVKSDDGTPICLMASFIDITERKKAEKALHESEKNYRELINGMNETVWVIDFNGNLIEVNKTATEVLGYSKEELLRIGLYGVDTTLKKESIKALAKSMPADKLQIFETTHTTKDGRTFPVEVYSSLVNYRGKQAILSIARDITERKRAEEAIRQSEIQFKTLFMSMSDGFYLSEVIYDDNGNPCDYRYLEVNPKFEQILGLRRDQIIGKRYKELVPVDTTQWLDNYCKVARTGTALTYEFYSDEYRMYFETYSYQPVKGQVSVFVRDITERKRADAALHSANERLKILNQMTEIVHETLEPDIIFKRITDAFVKSMGFSTALVLTKDENGDIFCVRSLSSSKLLLTRINKILGFPLKKLTFPVSGIIEDARKAAATSDLIIVNRLSDIAHPPLSKPVCNALQKLGGSKSYVLIPLVLDRKLIGGMLVSSILEQVPQTDINMLGAFASTAVQAINNAELLSRSNKAKDQVQKNLKEKEILLRELYHRTKNNMQVISSMLRLRARFIPDKQLQFAFSEIETKIRTMALVHKRLYESNDLSSLNLKVYIQDLIILIRQSYLTGEDQIRILYKAEDAPALIDTAIPLGLVLNELITNAIKHAFPQERLGEIRVSLGVGKKGELKLEVSDNGIGLPEGFDMKKDGRLGLGTILDMIKYQLDGEVTFENKNGLTCRIVIKKELYKSRV